MSVMGVSQVIPMWPVDLEESALAWGWKLHGDGTTPAPGEVVAPGERLEGSLALAAIAVMKGADVVRAHDVLATVRNVAMAEAVEGRFTPLAPVRGLWD